MEFYNLHRCLLLVQLLLAAVTAKTYVFEAGSDVHLCRNGQHFIESIRGAHAVSTENTIPVRELHTNKLVFEVNLAPCMCLLSLCVCVCLCLCVCVCSSSWKPFLTLVVLSGSQVDLWQARQHCYSIPSSALRPGTSYLADGNIFHVALEPQGEWIGKKGVPCGQFRSEFMIYEGLVEAWAYISGIGYYQLELNGNVVDPTRMLDPGWTTYQVSSPSFSLSFLFVLSFSLSSLSFPLSVFFFFFFFHSMLSLIPIFVERIICRTLFLS